MKAGHAPESILRLNKILIEEVIFKRQETEINFNDIGFNIKQSLFEGNDGSLYKVTVISEIKSLNTDELYIKVVTSGYFSFDQTEEINPETKDILLRRNTLSILFPYIRSFITTITSQTGMKPIIIPPININTLLEEMLENEKEEDQ